MTTTNSKLAALQAQAAAYNEIAADMNEVVNGGGGAEIIEGNHLCRLTQYIELGTHADEFEGQKKAPAPKFLLGFTIHQIDRSSGQPKFLDPVMHRTSRLSMSQNEKATAHKLFKRLNYKGTAKNFAELLGTAYMVSFKKEKLTKGKNAGKEVVRAQWLEIQAAVDPMSGQPYNVPDLVEDHLKLFIFDMPTKEGWDSLFIDGKKDDGGSKNWIQDLIVGALNYAGSKLETLVGGTVMPQLPADGGIPAPADAPAVPGNIPDAPEVPAVPDIPDIPAV